MLELLEALVRHDYGICFGGGILIGKKWRRSPESNLRQIVFDCTILMNRAYIKLVLGTNKG